MKRKQGKRRPARPRQRAKRRLRDPDHGRLFYLQCGRDERARDLALVAANPWRPDVDRRPVIHPHELDAYLAAGIEAIRNPKPPTADELRRFRALMADLRRRFRKKRAHR